MTVAREQLKQCNRGALQFQCLRHSSL